MCLFFFQKSGRISPTIVAGLPNDDCGLPLQLFGDVRECLLDVLQDAID